MSLSRPARTAIFSKGGIKCKECKKRKIILDENHETCQLCYEMFKPNLSGKKVIDDFIRNTQINFVTGSKRWTLEFLKAYYQIFLNNFFMTDGISEYFGITQDPITKDMMIIMPYYCSGDLVHYLSNDFFNISWETKLHGLFFILTGLEKIHRANIIHKDLHSGNIFFDKYHYAYIGDLGISRSATESNNDNEKYGIIPYMAPEIFQGQKYTEASDIYSFGMIMWEFMTGRRPFWDEIHDIELIIKICDGLRPPIVTNAPKGYIELMKGCWHSDPEKRPTARDISWKIDKMHNNETNINQTKIIKSSDIGPATLTNPVAIYKSRPLSRMIQSAMSLRSSRDTFYYYQKNTDKRKLEDDSVEDSNDNEQSIKRRKFLENENSDYFTKEIELDINMSSNQPRDKEDCCKDDNYEEDNRNKENELALRLKELEYWGKDLALKEREIALREREAKIREMELYNCEKERQLKLAN
ncbi:kinase-like protein [Rhizophagus irregularis]|nr:kinase-like protein [Rhizophagus irregularis]